MNQVKYLISASLILLGLLIVFLFYSLLPFEKRVQKSQAESPEKTTVASPPSAGQAIFQQNCQSCHALDKRLSGPALRGVSERGPWTDRKNIYKWVQNPAAFIPTTAYTVALHREYGQIMPSFPQLSENDIDAILEYIIHVSPSESMPVAIQ